KEIEKQAGYDIPFTRLNKEEASKMIIALEKIEEWKRKKGNL
ncbi:hypothetical protein HMPREF3206_01889, partial [Fusobacterium equinum]